MDRSMVGAIKATAMGKGRAGTLGDGFGSPNGRPFSERGWLPPFRNLGGFWPFF